MKKRNLALMVAAFNASLAVAGGLLTNTNQSVHFLRNPARDASTGIDAVYTNPAALIKLEPGLHFSINNQSAFQTRTITSTYAPFAYNGGSDTKEFEGKASAPIIPSVMGVYRVGDWALSGSISVIGGGGKATFNNGLPSFEAGLSQLPGVISLVGQRIKAQLDQAYPGAFPNAALTANQYSVDAYMEGSSIIYGAQLGGAYKINDMFSAYAGFRLNIVNNGYKGHLRDLKTNPAAVDLPAPYNTYNGAMIDASALIDMAIAGATDAQRAQLGLLKKASTDGVYLDCTQSGWGVAPILGFNFNYQDKLNVGVKYEFKTSLDVENKTEKDDTGLFGNGVNTPYDIPALLTIGASYKILPQLTASAGYHHFFDSDAEMSNGKQKYAGSTNEYLFGLEYQINPMFLVSAGGQITNYGVEDAYQQDLSFACDSYSIGLGGAVNVSPTVKINLGYFWTTYSDYTKEPGGGTTKDVFSRTNKVFGAGVDFRF
ncbi:MAG: aromatic hydrocarbon degradation protein [Prevotella sp.]|jgi:long-chain fatty acid transport protein|nr:aromatic hydrocarbon degradation protein [Prevotella sp.]